MTNKLPKLTARQELFCQEYTLDRNATQAAIRAGYSKNTAEKIGSKLLTKIEVKAKINDLTQFKAAKTNINAEWVLKEAAALYEICKGGITRDDGKVLANVAQAAISSLKLVGEHTKVLAFSQKNILEISGLEGNPVPIITREMSADEAEDIYKKMLK